MRISDWSSDVCSSDLSTANRQGRGAVLEGDEAQDVLDLLKSDATRAFDHYAAMLNEREDGTPLDPGRAGLARELARINLPIPVYTQRSEEPTSELQSLMRISYAVSYSQKKTQI